ncbi:tRNA (adenosine(37)-N6)-threonylcarbamoyltransferase complex dimerization subunit type 1 TsaB [Micrococcales bacterium 31B]|nr:tRNA (adenosine(37)-N6)-threonylcarbamoyltransferase complex dimerization subunit type 1 TsaB [Micrococcales bacterium 31B]
MFLALDTSSGVSVALYDPTDRSVVAESFLDGARHTEHLMPVIDNLLTGAGVPRRDLTAVCVGRGPGPFTGLRVGLATAHTLAFALRVPQHAVSSLEVIAASAAIDRAPGDVLGVAIDARRREAYYAAYRVEAAGPAAPVLTEVLPPSVGKPDAAAAALSDARVGSLAGAAGAIYPEAFAQFTAIDRAHAEAGMLARYAHALLERGADLTEATPLYLRKPDAELPSARKSTLGPR